MLLLLRSRTFRGDDLSCKWEALTATRLFADAAIGGGRAGRALPRRLADVALTNRVTDANDHGDWIQLMRLSRNSRDALRCFVSACLQP